jgi:hypothetical protein
MMTTAMAKHVRCFMYSYTKHVKLEGTINSVALVRYRTMPTERPPLLGEVVPTFADRGCCVVSAADHPGRILGFLDRSRYYFFQVAPQLY